MSHLPNEMQFCRGCATDESAAEDMAHIGEYIAFIKVDACMPDGQYAQGQEVYARCPGLINVNTCRYSGYLWRFKQTEGYDAKS